MIGDDSMCRAADAEGPSGGGTAEGSEKGSGTQKGPEKGSEKGAAVGGETEPTISIDDFAKVKLRVARILEVEPHPNADRLLKMQIDLGDERRQLVAGLASHYSPEDLVGRQIVVVANLKPAKLRGELSQGMLLAASDGDGVAILTPARPVAPGASVS